LVYCTKCGYNNPEEAEFCSRCGEHLVVEARFEGIGERIERGAEEFGETISRGFSQCFGQPIKERKKRDDFGIFSFGFVLILIGSLYILNPSLPNQIVVFFRDFRLVEIYSNVWLPAPTSNHPGLYEMIQQFCFVFGSFQIVILAGRFIFNSPNSKKADTFSAIIFWYGAGFLTRMLSNFSVTWFTFLGGLIILVGASIIIRVLFSSVREQILR
jgi:hypothetical protein